MIKLVINVKRGQNVMELDKWFHYQVIEGLVKIQIFSMLAKFLVLVLDRLMNLIIIIQENAKKDILVICAKLAQKDIQDKGQIYVMNVQNIAQMH